MLNLHSYFSTDVTGGGNTLTGPSFSPTGNGRNYQMAWVDSCQKLLLTFPNFWNIIQNLYFYADSVETIIQSRSRNPAKHFYEIF